jgi:CheY-like chemotaxis protein
MIASPVRAAGRRVLLVEDEYLLADRIAREFARLGIETIGPTSTVKRALDLVKRGGHLDGAVLDIRLRDDLVFPVAEALRARGIPFVFATGYDEQTIPDQYRDVAHLHKPLDPAQVLRALFSQADQIP